MGNSPLFRKRKNTEGVNLSENASGPTAVSGESGLFAKTGYELFCQGVESSDDDTVWKEVFDNGGLIYVYTPKSRVALVRFILANHKISYVINDFSLDESRVKGKNICHFSVQDMQPWQKEKLISFVKFGGAVTPLNEYLENNLGFTEIGLLNDEYYLYKKSFSALRKKHHVIPKRIIDIVFSLILGFLALPICMLTAILIKVESRGPVLYFQSRVGQFNRQFRVIKFRSMYADAEKNGIQWAKKNDCRVTRVGKILRKTRIDEIPQLINVLKGEMSVVGPRPERDFFVASLEKEIPYYRFRHAVKPGVTGYAQVSYPYGSSVEDAKWKHKYDMFYIKNQTLWFDVKIIVKTIGIIIFGKGN